MKVSQMRQKLIEQILLSKTKMATPNYPSIIFRVEKSQRYSEKLKLRLGQLLCAAAQGTHQLDLFCTSNAVLRHLGKSGLLIDREAQVEVQFWSKESSG